MSGQKPKAHPEFYQDSAVVAYRVPAAELPMAELRPTVTSSGGAIEAASLSDGDFATSVSLPIAAAGKTAWIQFEFPQPAAQSAALRLP